jgi:iron complex transport system permease protein
MERNIAIIVSIAAAVSVFCLFAAPAPINPFEPEGVAREILFSIRLPRVVAALLIGGALGACGVVLQGLLRNPLADPYILGISSGAALFAAGGLSTGAVVSGLPLLAFAGAALTSAIVATLGRKRGTVVPERLLLAGIGVGFFFSALLMLVMSVSEESGMRRAVLWLFGDLSLIDWGLLPFGAVTIIAGLLVSISRKKALNALTLGDEIAHGLGFSPSRERLVLFSAVSLMAAAAVSLGGIIGFVGLLVPHVMRFSVGSDARVLLPLSTVAGGGLLVVADTIGKTVIAPAELPSGVMTALIGAPYFLYLLKKKI